MKDEACQTEQIMEHPRFINMLLRCVPVQKEKHCLMLLEHLAQLDGACAFDASNGEIVFDKQLCLCESNMCEVVRFLLSSPRPNCLRTPEEEEQCGVHIIASILAKHTSLPASIISHPYWRDYITTLRSKNVASPNDHTL